jgi:hypothetical protein
VVTFLLCVRALHRRNRVSPQIPTIAPLTWLFLPERPARLHRRLRRAVSMARTASALHTRTTGPGAMTIPELVADLERRACVIDNQLVIAARATGPARWAILNEMERQVYEVDTLAGRVAGMATAWASNTATATMGPAGLAALGERLDALESAMYQVGALGSGRHPSFDPVVPPQPIPYLRPVRGEHAD